MKTFQTFYVCFAIAVLVGAASACQKRPSDEKGAQRARQQSPRGVARSVDSMDKLPHGVNPVQNEMRLLSATMQNVLSMIANDNLEAIPPEIKKIHPARQLTQKAIKNGDYAPPKNADKLKKFKKLDRGFHKNLKSMVKAAKDGDLEATSKQYGKLVNGCTGCHAKFRY